MGPSYFVASWIILWSGGIMAAMEPVAATQADFVPPPHAWPPAYGHAQASAPATAPASSQQASDFKTLIDALKTCPDFGQAPVAVREIVAKYDKQKHKLTTKELHKSASALGGARKRLAQVQEGRAQHMEAWKDYLEKSTERFKENIAIFKSTMQQFAEAEMSCLAEIHQARQAIEELMESDRGGMPSELSPAALQAYEDMKAEMEEDADEEEAADTPRTKSVKRPEIAYQDLDVTVGTMQKALMDCMELLKEAPMQKRQKTQNNESKAVFG
ncbi:unnamed protein product [Durusdinium trenchii]|uniref:Uncharacterized protein n=1 Tax=Durusdinium trenchii TaxID=1381693 RepID=A0ABP0N8I6_9DINO